MNLKNKLSSSWKHRGLLAWAMSIFIILFYTILYFDDKLDSLLSFKPILQKSEIQISNLKNKIKVIKENVNWKKDPTKTQLIKNIDKEITQKKEQLYILKLTVIRKNKGSYVSWKDKQGNLHALNSKQKMEADKLQNKVVFQRISYNVYKNLNSLSYLLRAKEADKWFLYGFIYTVLVSIFGFRFILKWKKNPYQKLRTLSIIFVQFIFAFTIPAILELIHSKSFYFSYFWPLKMEYLFPSKLSSLPIAMSIWAVLMGFIAVPVLTYYFGKRWYCSWACGCGALANTFGDDWRHLSNKKKSAWQLEKKTIYTVLLLAVATTIIVIINFFRGPIDDSFNHFVVEVQNYYAYIVAMVLAGVIGTGFYPLAGTRVWCRFFCPQAAILGILQKFFSRFRISINGSQCMACGNCSVNCEMGIDVRSYAMQGQSFVRASCVGCGLCQAVCPRGVIKLETLKTREKVKAEF